LDECANQRPDPRAYSAKEEAVLGARHVAAGVRPGAALCTDKPEPAAKPDQRACQDRMPAHPAASLCGVASEGECAIRADRASIASGISARVNGRYTVLETVLR